MKKLLSETCRRRLGAAIAMLLLFVCAVSAQNKRIAGSVVDGNGDPLPGATISVVGNKDLGTTTDINGKFSIDVPQNAVLQFSFIGYKPHQVRAQAANDHMSIMLTEDSQELDDVVVTALGISREAKSLGYARQSVDTESLLDARDANLLNSLSGKVSGVNIISNGGPMASTRVEIRGNNSITGNNQPLYVVDGVPIMNDMGESGDLDYGNPASFISPDDVESIEVLKGANAAALYGSEAANGVILITTKKGQSGKLRVEYSGSATLKTVGLMPELMNIDQWATGVRQAITNDGFTTNGWQNWWAYTLLAQQYKGHYIDKATQPDPFGGSAFGDTADFVFDDTTDWLGTLFGSSWSTNQSLSLSGGTDKMSYRISGSFLYDGSPLKYGKNNNRRFNLRFNNTYKFNKIFTLESSIAYSRQEQVAPTQIGAALTTNLPMPGLPLQTLDGSLSHGEHGVRRWQRYSRAATTSSALRR